jgi:hypothetical protein
LDRIDAPGPAATPVPAMSHQDDHETEPNMATTEWWQRGPVDGIPAVVQPVAHILLQVRESVGELVENLTEFEWNACIVRSGVA